ncbi:hypothetical protein IWX49DRAFT_570410 [Phyllosticta citricarpa]
MVLVCQVRLAGGFRPACASSPSSGMVLVCQVRLAGGFRPVCASCSSLGHFQLRLTGVFCPVCASSSSSGSGLVCRLGIRPTGELRMLLTRRPCTSSASSCLGLVCHLRMRLTGGRCPTCASCSSPGISLWRLTCDLRPACGFPCSSTSLKKSAQFSPSLTSSSKIENCGGSSL